MSHKPLQVGVTGGIGTGKSTICRMFEIMGVPCYNADQRARWLMENDDDVVEGVKGLLGSAAYEKGKLNRQLVADAAFEDQSILEKVNQLVHPRVGADYAKWLGQQNHPFIVKEAALLFESGSYQSLDYLITVTAPVDLRKARVQKRDPFRTAGEIQNIMDRQMPQEEKISLSDAVIQNDEEHSLIDQVLDLQGRLLARRS